MSATDAAFAPGLWPTAILRCGRSLQIDAVIAGAVADDGAERRQHVHHAPRSGVPPAVIIALTSAS